jgi:hypothetical protein
MGGGWEGAVYSGGLKAVLGMSGVGWGWGGVGWVAVVRWWPGSRSSMASAWTSSGRSEWDRG